MLVSGRVGRCFPGFCLVNLPLLIGCGFANVSPWLIAIWGRTFIRSFNEFHTPIQIAIFHFFCVPCKLLGIYSSINKRHINQQFSMCFHLQTAQTKTGCFAIISRTDPCMVPIPIPSMVFLHIFTYIWSIVLLNCKYYGKYTIVPWMRHGRYIYLL